MRPLPPPGRIARTYPFRFVAAVLVVAAIGFITGAILRLIEIFR